MLYREEEVKELRPYRLQYSLKEAAYMLDCSEDTLRNWATRFDVEIYKINNKGKNYVEHDDLVTIQTRGRAVRELTEVM
jgi:hypothetical protein